LDELISGFGFVPHTIPLAVIVEPPLIKIVSSMETVESVIFVTAGLEKRANP